MRPGGFAELLDGQDGSVRHRDLTWSVKAYVSHVADNIRGWAEHIRSGTAAGQTLLRPVDPDAMAAIRGYEHMSVQTALWSLKHSASIWADAIAASGDRDFEFTHPTRGQQSLAELVLTVAHDTAHHEWDIQRSLAGS